MTRGDPAPRDPDLGSPGRGGPNLGGPNPGGLDVIWVAPCLASLGGSEYAVAAFARLLVGSGHRLRLLTGPTVHPAWRNALQLPRLQVIEHENDAPQALCDRLESLLRERPADLVQFMPIEAHCLAWLERGVATPVIGWEPTDLSPRCWWLPVELKQAIHRLAGLLTLNPGALRHAREDYGYRGPVQLLPNALLGSPRLCEPRFPPDAAIFACIARLSAEKGLEFLLAAFALLSRECRRARLHIWGDGEDGPRLRQLACMLGIDARVHWEGAFDPVEDIERIALGAQVFVLSSLFEGAPVALLELVARGRPVAASATTGARWVCGDDYPWLAPVGDTRALADAMLALLEPETASRAGQRLREHHAQRFGARQSLDALLDLYGQALRPEGLP